MPAKFSGALPVRLLCHLAMAAFALPVPKAAAQSEVRGATADPTELETLEAGENPASDQTDHRARVIDAEGEVRVLKPGASEWISAETDQTLEAGDKLITGPDGSATVAYDAYLLNLTRIEPNTLAVFRSIEPTRIDLQDGTLFNALEGLESGTTYEVATPTLVAGVRGTRFDVEYDAQLKRFSAAAVPGESSGTQSRIRLRSPQHAPGEPEVEIREGQQFDFSAGDTLKSVTARQIDPERVSRAETHFSRMNSRIKQFKDFRTRGLEKRFGKRPAQKPSGKNLRTPAANRAAARTSQKTGARPTSRQVRSIQPRKRPTLRSQKQWQKPRIQSRAQKGKAPQIQKRQAPAQKSTKDQQKSPASKRRQ